MEQEIISRAPENKDDWPRWATHVLLELQRLNKSLVDLNGDMNNLRTKMAEDLSMVKRYDDRFKDVFEEIEELKERCKKIDALRDVFAAHEAKNAADISALNVKSGVWGGLGGLLAAIGVLLMGLASGILKGK